MKKICVMLLMLLGACSKSNFVPFDIAGWDIWPQRNAYIEKLQSWPIYLFDQGPKLKKSEQIREVNFPTNEVLLAFKGQVIMDDRTYLKQTFSVERLRANKDGRLSTSGMDIAFKKSEERPVIGLATVDGDEFFLIPAHISGFAVMVNDDGTFHRHIGQIRNDMLVVLDDDYFPTPTNLKMEPVITTSTIRDITIKGFEIKYDGIVGKEISFTVYEFAESNGTYGEFRTYKFPSGTTEVNIEGVRIKIFFADDVKLEYMLN